MANAQQIRSGATVPNPFLYEETSDNAIFRKCFSVPYNHQPFMASSSSSYLTTHAPRLSAPVTPGHPHLRVLEGELRKSTEQPAGTSAGGEMFTTTRPTCATPSPPSASSHSSSYSSSTWRMGTSTSGVTTRGATPSATCDRTQHSGPSWTESAWILSLYVSIWQQSTTAADWRYSSCPSFHVPVPVPLLPEQMILHP